MEDEGLPAGVVVVAVLAEKVAVAVGFGGEPQRALGALVGFLARVRQDVTPQRRRPRELARAVRAAHPVRRVAVGRFLLRHLQITITSSCHSSTALNSFPTRIQLNSIELNSFPTRIQLNSIESSWK